ncbi:putative linoleate 9S-lipoxygenase 7 [Nymphaea thermarum]|nr:putative linoleate 9S-lipoxygenase 7 [Nymphaea thermarum]
MGLWKRGARGRGFQRPGGVGPVRVRWWARPYGVRSVGVLVLGWVGWDGRWWVEKEMTLGTEFPPTSKLDPAIYGPRTSTITAEHIEKFLQGLTVHEALNKHRLFILDHYEAIMPYVNRINTTDNKIYASRTVLFLKNDGTLTPLAIELCLPNHEGQDQMPCGTGVFECGGLIRRAHTKAGSPSFPALTP